MTGKRMAGIGLLATMFLLCCYASTYASLPEEDGGAAATQTAIRGTQAQVTPTDPPPPPPPTLSPRPPAGLGNCEEMRWYRENAGLPAIFDRIGWRESNCRNEESVHTFCCWGYWQMYVSLHLRSPELAPLYRWCGVGSRYDLDSDTHEDKLRQACVARALYTLEGTSPWAATR
jgi:hypothetical protein